LPQAPQLAGSLPVSVQVPPQLVWGSEQAHTPFTQLVPARQALPQAPQWLFELGRCAQAPLQLVRPAAQVAAQEPLLHTLPSAQRWPQDPQLRGSLAGSTQASPQRTAPAAQTQLLPLQIWETPQALPQAPQFCSSEETLMHELPQVVKPVAQVAAQRPRLQTWPAAQALPQLPQFAGLVSRFAQSAPHRVSAAAQGNPPPVSNPGPSTLTAPSPDTGPSPLAPEPSPRKAPSPARLPPSPCCLGTRIDRLPQPTTKSSARGPIVRLIVIMGFSLITSRTRLTGSSRGRRAWD
jgi:hypothetical protein